MSVFLLLQLVLLVNTDTMEIVTLPALLVLVLKEIIVRELVLLEPGLIMEDVIVIVLLNTQLLMLVLIVVQLELHWLMVFVKLVLELVVKVNFSMPQLTLAVTVNSLVQVVN